MMKKSIVLIIVLLFSAVVQAKTVTCNGSSYVAEIVLINDKLFKNDKTKVNIISDVAYNAMFISDDVNILKIDELGQIEALNEGQADILVNISFGDDSSSIEMCNVQIPIKVLSSNSKLSLLDIEELEDIDFKPEIYEYDIEVPTDIEKINIVAIPSSSNATVTGSGRRYVNDKDTYDITVTSSDGTSSIYKLNVQRNGSKIKKNKVKYPLYRRVVYKSILSIVIMTFIVLFIRLKYSIIINSIKSRK